ncbi:MAG TPA: signal peptidase II [Chloroflexota bacterium]|nr:signal peptidase II [Chloroflexota bacterium]
MARGWLDGLFLATAGAVYATDQVTKAWAVRTLGPGSGRDSIQVVGDWVRLSYTTNTGAAFGILPSGSALFTVIAVVAVPVIWYFNRTMRPRTVLTRICLGGLLGGALGNLTDRLRHGYVVDFVDAGIGTLRWPAFNVADSAFVVGVIALSLYMLFFESRHARTA